MAFLFLEAPTAAVMLVVAALGHGVQAGGVESFLGGVGMESRDAMRARGGGVVRQTDYGGV